MRVPLRISAIHGLLLLCVCVTAMPPGLHAQEAGFVFRQSIPFLADPATAAGFQPLRNAAQPHYDVVALRVEFRPDTSRFSTGDGTFGDAIYEGLPVSVDPLPHDAGFFRARLAFLENYMERVSNGLTRVTTHLVPEVIRLDREMGAYSPTGFDAGSDEELRKLATMVQEAWEKATLQSAFDLSGFDPERTAFILFHAGSGRDIELTGTVLDKTPEDIPSLVFGRQALHRLLDGAALSFNGFPVNHSIILPRTHSRLGFNFITRERFVVEFSTNGMLAASFFSFLGVPDLFDTETGLSGIGPFGLMDPYGIFAYNGLFPPEPTAWTKYYLGWLEPEVVTGSDPRDLQLRANSIEGVAEAVKVPISESEYFLVENRNRDPFAEELTLHVWRDGGLVQQRAAHRNDGFTRFDVSAFEGGTVVSASNYDWALPGGVGEDGSPQRGGILIWHIDERRLAERIGSNSVNVGPDRRAVNLQEADGAQDIGYPSPSPLGPQPHLGTPFDFFYEGNPVRVVTGTGREIRLYRNRFGPDTHPNSHSNLGGPSFVVIENFSPAGAEMTFRYYLEESAGLSADIAAGELELEVPVDAASAVFDFAAESGSYHMVYAAGAGALIAVDAERHTVEARWDAVTGMPAAWTAGQLVFVQGAPGNRSFVRWNGQEEHRVALAGALASGEQTTPLVTAEEGGLRRVYAGWRDGGAHRLVRLHPDGDYEIEDLGGNPVLGIAAVPDGRVAVVTRAWAEIRPGGARVDLNLPEHVTTAGVAFGGAGDRVVGFVYTPQDASATWVLPGGRTTPVRLSQFVSAPGNVDAGWQPILADVEGRGRLDAVMPYGRHLFAFTQGGAVTANFPVTLPAAIIGQPIVVRTGDERDLILVGTAEGYLHAVDARSGHTNIAGFPLAVGASVGGTAQAGTGSLTAASASGSFRKWRWTDAAAAVYGKLYGSTFNDSFTFSAAQPPSETPAGGSLLVARETYNWPNPVRDGYTFLRVEVGQPSRVEVLITDIAGARIDEIEIGSVMPGAPTEIRWDTSAPSGVYLARVRATSETGETDTRVVRMAIIR